tara:strand:- start:28 stop:222 length:195 start_codon:yes stop_codon:yes gene_type:complete
MASASTVPKDINSRSRNGRDFQCAVIIAIAPSEPMTKRGTPYHPCYQRIKPPLVRNDNNDFSDF